MTIEVEPDSADEKNNFLNKQYMAFRLIYMSVSSKIQYHVEDLSLSTPDKVWTKLEVLFRIKEYFEEYMQDIDKTKPIEKP
jgi:hypothetical protein